MNVKKFFKTMFMFVLVAVLMGNTTVYAAMSPGESGSAVTAMQKKLIALGYLSSSANGSYNSATMNAVKLFESLNGLSADGFADDTMLAQLDAAYNGAARITVKSSPLNVRKGAGTKYAKLGTVKKGASYVVLGTKKVSGTTWYSFKYGTKTGWVCGKYVTYTAASANITTVKTATITTSSLNVRAGAGTKYAKAGTLKKGATVTIAGSKTVSGSTWYSYYANGKKLWFSGKYATVKSYIALKSTASTTASTNASTTASTTAGESAARKITTGVSFGKVTISSLNVRKGPGTSYAKVATASKGSVYPVLGSKSVSGTKWYKILYKGKARWVCGKYLSVSKKSYTVDYVDLSTYTSDKPCYLTRTVVINDEAAILYADSGSTEALLLLEAGVTYNVYGSKGYNGTSWYRLNVNGVEGYISRYNVTVTNHYETIADRDFSSKTPVIYLSPSKQYANSYIVGNTSEKAEMEALADVLYEKLKAYDCTVYIAPKTMDLYDRAQHAYSLNTDIYIAIHSNAKAGSTVEYGASAYYFPGCAQGKLYAQSIVDSLNKIAPKGTNLKKQVMSGMNLAGGFGYAEVREPGRLGMIGLLVETDYHDYAPTAKWLINEKDAIADAYVESLVNAFGLKLRDAQSNEPASATDIIVSASDIVSTSDVVSSTDAA